MATQLRRQISWSGRTPAPSVGRQASGLLQAPKATGDSLTPLHKHTPASIRIDRVSSPEPQVMLVTAEAAPGHLCPALHDPLVQGSQTGGPGDSSFGPQGVMFPLLNYVPIFKNSNIRRFKKERKKSKKERKRSDLYLLEKENPKIWQPSLCPPYEANCGWSLQRKHALCTSPPSPPLSTASQQQAQPAPLFPKLARPL